MCNRSDESKGKAPSSDEARKEKERNKKARWRAKKRLIEEQAKAKLAQFVEKSNHDPNEGGPFEQFIVPQLKNPTVKTMESIVALINKLIVVEQLGTKIVNRPKRSRTDDTDQHRRHIRWIDEWDIYVKFDDVDDATRSHQTHWFQVRPSSLPEAGLGLYAAVDFKEGWIIGFYAGVEIRHVTDPSVQYKHAIRSTQWGLVDAQMGFADPDCVQQHMGMHMMNDPTMGLRKNTKEWKKANERINVTTGPPWPLNGTLHHVSFR